MDDSSTPAPTSAIPADELNRMTDELIAYHEARAKGGCGI